MMTTMMMISDDDDDEFDSNNNKHNDDNKISANIDFNALCKVNEAVCTFLLKVTDGQMVKTGISVT